MRSRPRPAPRVVELPAIETQVFAEENVSVEDFREWMRSRGLALVISRSVTVRDDADRQQPFNLRVPGGPSDPSAGRRVLAQPMQDPAVANPPNPGGPAGSVAIAADGSMAALVPARRAMTWQTTDPAGVGVVRERYWVSFQPGEIRTCHSCHAVNRDDQAGQPTPTNEPEALRELLQHLQDAVAIHPETPGASPGLTLLENVPNPMRESTELRLIASAPQADAMLEVWGVDGRVLVRESLGPLPAGLSRFTWTAHDGNGRKLAPGVYFYRVGAGTRVSEPRKVSIVR